MRLRNLRLLAATVVALTLAATPAVAAFTPGDIVVYRIGDGIRPFEQSGNSVFLDDFAPTGSQVQPVSSVALPTAAAGANAPFAGVGTEPTQGLLTRSANGRLLLATGYGVPSPNPALTPLPGSSATSVPRVIAEVDAAGTVDTSTALRDYADGAVPRGAASVDGGTLYGVGGPEGLIAATRGANRRLAGGAGAGTDQRAVQIVGGQLMSSSAQGGGGVSIATVGTGTPGTVAGLPVTPLPGFPTATGAPGAFLLLDLVPGVGISSGADTLYVADVTAGSIEKYRFDGNAFRAAGSAALTNATGLAGYATAGTVHLFATFNSGTAGGGGGGIYALDDPAAATSTLAGTPTQLMTGLPYTSYRGIALAPVAATATDWAGGRARAGRRGVLVSWRTGGGADDLGFDVLRVRRDARARVRLTHHLVAGSAVVGRTGRRRSFAFRDRHGHRGDAYYVVTQTTAGGRKAHGPFLAHAATGP